MKMPAPTMPPMTIMVASNSVRRRASVASAIAGPAARLPRLARRRPRRACRSTCRRPRRDVGRRVTRPTTPTSASRSRSTIRTDFGDDQHLAPSPARAPSPRSQRTAVSPFRMPARSCAPLTPASARRPAPRSASPAALRVHRGRARAPPADAGRRLHHVSLPAGGLLFRQGESGDAVYFVDRRPYVRARDARRRARDPRRGAGTWRGRRRDGAPLGGAADCERPGARRLLAPATLEDRLRRRSSRASRTRSSPSCDS